MRPCQEKRVGSGAKWVTGKSGRSRKFEVGKKGRGKEEGKRETGVVVSRDFKAGREEERERGRERERGGGESFLWL